MKYWAVFGFGGGWSMTSLLLGLRSVSHWRVSIGSPLTSRRSLGISVILWLAVVWGRLDTSLILLWAAYKYLNFTGGLCDRINTHVQYQHTQNPLAHFYIQWTIEHTYTNNQASLISLCISQRCPCKRVDSNHLDQTHSLFGAKPPNVSDFSMRCLEFNAAHRKAGPTYIYTPYYIVGKALFWRLSGRKTQGLCSKGRVYIGVPRFIRNRLSFGESGAGVL